ncbi:NAD(P)H-quinone oxidoreductase [Geobacter sulfurreducens]|uniref:NADPH:quinone oxidoreductase family protein PIG3 n=1 Tax=Geobacter sulfurreducens (strain ATCC 51573 / DSM 12127 / PCA) TaxID=243231 RepID=Q749V5_GEOSL|nr:NAD(P)H-quinone oxidoreductase [Geobacter sulfurreducens]AAR36009.1 NADPH:quinone oxidoreductase family protein PIG3 [Geobacter sulfurreducens PCA]ADI85388.1 NADPH:quinone oxidoreductase family protein PIG3 [Geobacter sulfurreducens KN400]QVW34460.1 NAD(P)H-quinone oxidoreductase [Geobacter sulfurreducens]UAC03334.1 NAD(P)H-quinone oxidoreductase [Geobacter sulfurreducens]UTG91978.1 NAD(P)H-quinone oxidoreductase [Geobacter sulfurreducens]
MKAVLLDGFGGLDVLKVGEAERPKPAEGQVLVKVVATSVNRPDLVQREGKYPPPPGDSEILGLEVSGTIEELGPGVTGWQVGDRVMSLVGGGGYAEYAVAYASHLMRIPESMSFEEAACVCESYITAFLNVFMIGGLKDNNSVILHGGGGGVNTAGIQLCKALVPNTKIVATAHPSKIDRVKALGADLVVDFTQTPDFSEAVKEFTNKKGVDVILDHVGAKYLAPNMNSLAYAGRLVIIGVISGIKAELNLALMMVKRQQIIGSVLRSRPVKDKGEIVAEFTRTALPKFADRTIVPIIEKVFPMDQVVEAHRMMEEDKHFGKIVLKIS